MDERVLWNVMRENEFLDDLDDGGWEEGENKFYKKFKTKKNKNF